MSKAEENSKEIAWILQTLGASASYINASIMPPRGLAGSSGLYVFFAVTNQCERVPTGIPIYCGFTSRPFDRRCYEHFTQQNGAIHRFSRCDLSDQPNISTQKFIIWTLSASGMMGKLVESLLLSEFDFALNFSENGDIRNLSNKWSEAGDCVSVHEINTQTVIWFFDAIKEAKKDLDCLHERLINRLGW